MGGKGKDYLGNMLDPYTSLHNKAKALANKIIQTKYTANRSFFNSDAKP